MIRQTKNNKLYFDGCNTVDLAKKYGTPLYVLSETSMKEKFLEIDECFLKKHKKTRAAYAGKAFLTLAMCKIVERQGFSLDVVSGGELFTALKAGFPANRIEFNGNNKSNDELEYAIDSGVGRIIMDGLDEQEIIEELCDKKGKKANVLYRITPGVKSDTHDYIVTGKKDSKFGIPVDDNVLYPAVEKAIKSRFVNFLGYHFHVGSQLLNNESHLQALDILLDVIKNTWERFEFLTPEMNIGGGFGIRYTDADERKPYSYFLDPIMARTEQFFSNLGLERPSVVIEPGRSIVGEAGLTLYSVGTIKDLKGIRKYVAVDGGMTDNIRPALYGAKYEAVIANKADQADTDTITVCGKCCESGDILIKDLKAPIAERGDILAVFSTGAYGYSMASNYNKNPIPAVILVNNGQSELIVKRQSYEHMISNEIVPDYLL
ncbi:diaminopimelate decarboxylase [Spirochaetota bacterium]